MGGQSSIEWCDATFNPWIGCTKVGPGCDNCYAEADFDKRKHVAQWGAGNPRHRTSAANWSKPLAWNKAAANGLFVQCDGCGRREFRKWDNTLPPGGLACCSNPECNALPESDCSTARPRVFCASLADVFDNEVDPKWRFDLFALICATPHLDWLLLTKRIGNAGKMLNAIAPSFAAMLDSNDRYKPLPNLWIGATIVNQEEADRDIQKLLQIPAAVRFLSVEPMLGAIQMKSCWLHKMTLCGGCPSSDEGTPVDCPSADERIDWIIAGGESGPNARPMHPFWVRNLSDQCQQAGAPFLFKQWGEFVPMMGHAEGVPVSGEKFIHPDGTIMGRAGKKSAGRLLFGRTWDQFPEVQL